MLKYNFLKYITGLSFINICLSLKCLLMTFSVKHWYLALSSLNKAWNKIRFLFSCRLLFVLIIKYYPLNALS
jgi:hypothetical protein